MIHTRVSRDTNTQLTELHISVTAESLPNFLTLVDRALNTWDSAPKELKEFGDMLTHGRITQDHTRLKIASGLRTDYYTPEEHQIITEYIAYNGRDAWLEKINSGKIQEIFKSHKSQSQSQPPTSPSSPT